MRFERTVAALAGLGLAASAIWLVPWSASGWMIALVSPPYLMGVIVAAIAASSRPAWRRAWLGASDFAMMAATAIYAVLGFFAYVVPGALVMFLATGYFATARFGAYDERPARVVIANGLLWTFVFVIVRHERDVPGVELALISSVAMGVAGFAWWRAVVRERDLGRTPPRAVAR